MELYYTHIGKSIYIYVNFAMGAVSSSLVSQRSPLRPSGQMQLALVPMTLHTECAVQFLMLHSGDSARPQIRHKS